jgi:hypothetical protein
LSDYLIEGRDRWDHDIPEVINPHLHDDCEVPMQHDDVTDEQLIKREAYIEARRRERKVR